MSDPFSKATDRRMVREAQIGLTMITGLLALFVYLTYNRITGNGIEIPESVRRSRTLVARLESQQTLTPRLPQADIAPVDDSVRDSDPPLGAVAVIDDDRAEGQTIQLTGAEIPAPDSAANRFELPRSVEAPDRELPKNPVTELPAPGADRSREEHDENAFQPTVARPSLEFPGMGNTTPATPEPVNHPVDDPFATVMANGQSPRSGSGGDFDATTTETQTTRPTPRQPIRLPKQGNLRPDQPVVMERPPSTIATAISQPDDSWFLIAQRTYGDAAWMSALAEFNRIHGRAHESLQPGTLVLTPAIDRLRREFPGLCPAQRAGQPGGPVESLYVTKAGETLFGIARDELGQASRYLEIYELNRSLLDPEVTHLTRLPAGMRLVLPELNRSSDQ